MAELQEVIKEFLLECHENLDQLDRDLLMLEQDPGNRDGLSSIFRTIHTIKGTCGFFDFHQLGAVTHAGEHLLAQLRDGKLNLSPEITSALLHLVDVVRGILGHIERTGEESKDDQSELIQRLTRLTSDDPAPPPTTPGHPAPVPVEEVGEALDGPGGLSESAIRVDVGLLDKLMNLVGELVLARNQLLQCTSARSDAVFLRTTQRLNLITTELQEGVMKTRLQPIANVWNKFPRVTRDLAMTCGKQVRLTMEGKDTELDKSIIEAIKDPLTHLLRNAIDHGVETPEVRRQQGKPAEGNIVLRAYHEGGQVNIEMSDDGAGIDPQRIAQKAVEKGLITREQAARLNERELLHLIFLPGFSTKESVTSVSGRGVGLDVVKTNIEKISGTLDLHSRPGHGATVRIKIPLTLAIIPALLASSGGDCYAIPQVSLLELVRLEGEQARLGIEWIHGAPVYRLRGNLLPLVYLNKALQVQDRPAEADRGVVNIVVLQADDRPFGLVVDGISDTEEIVVKPLNKQLKGIPVYAGATILGDGRVALILDVLGLAQSASVVAEVRERARNVPMDRPDECACVQTVLLVGLGKGRRLAIPLSRVARLEEVPLSAVERSGGRDAFQYRGRILPLLRLSDVVGEAPLAAGMDPMQVVVYSEQGRNFGLIVDRILDIVETVVDLQPTGTCPGVRGSAVIQQFVTDVLDVEHLFCDPSPSPGGSIAAGRGRI